LLNYPKTPKPRKFEIKIYKININNLKMSNPAGENAAPEDEDNEKGI